MKITIVGGGNIGTLMAAEFAHKGNEVTIFTSSPERFERNIKVSDNDGGIMFEAEIACITKDIDAAIDADYIFVTLPSIAQGDFANKIAKKIKKDTRIGVIPGYGGAEFIFKDVISRGAKLFGFQRVHAISRLDEYGKQVCMKGRKDSVYLSALDPTLTPRICRDMEVLFDMPCIALPNYLCVTLTPSNPILHTSRLFGMFNDFAEEKRYEKNILFYEEWTDFDSQVLFDADTELQQICSAMDFADLSSVRSLKDHYESHTVPALTDKIRSISAFRGIGSPMKEVSDGWVPDFSSRYFTCDFVYGLALLCQFGDVLGISTPTMDRVMAWYRDVSGDMDQPIDLSSCGIDSKKAIFEFYNFDRI